MKELGSTEKQKKKYLPHKRGTYDNCFFKKLFEKILHVWVLCLCVSKCIICMQYPWRLEETAGSFGTGVTDHCEPVCGCWKRKLGPLKEQTRSALNCLAITPSPVIIVFLSQIYLKVI